MPDVARTGLGRATARRGDAAAAAIARATAAKPRMRTRAARRVTARHLIRRDPRSPGHRRFPIEMRLGQPIGALTKRNAPREAEVVPDATNGVDGALTQLLPQVPDVYIDEV